MRICRAGRGVRESEGHKMLCMIYKDVEWVYEKECEEKVFQGRLLFFGSLLKSGAGGGFGWAIWNGEYPGVVGIFSKPLGSLRDEDEIELSLGLLRHR